MLADVMKIEQVPFDSHFFDDLGADSLVMAKFCARVRKREGLPVMSMQDIYAHPSIRRLAQAFGIAEAEAEVNLDAIATLIQPRDPILARSAAPRRPAPGSTSCAGRCNCCPSSCTPGRRAGRRPGVRVDIGRPGLRADLPEVGALRRRRLHRPVHASDPGQVGAHRPVEAPADPHLESGVLPLLDRQDAGQVEPPGSWWASARRCTRGICGRWAPRSGGGR